MGERSLSFETALQDLATLLHRLALIQIVPQALDDDDPDARELRELAALFTADELQLHYQIAAQARSEIGLAPDEYAGFTMALLRMLAFAPADAPPQARTAERAAPRAKAAESAPARPAAPPVRRAEAGSASWPQIIEDMKLAGAAKQLADRCELAKIEPGRVELRIAPGHDMLMKPAQDKLKAALREHFGTETHVTISVGAASGESPADIAARKRAEQQARAEQAIENDDFVRDLVGMGGRVSAIKPNGNGA
jgi:DNA polymerase-3 subunit gamma/tau